MSSILSSHWQNWTSIPAHGTRYLSLQHPALLHPRASWLPSNTRCSLSTSRRSTNGHQQNCEGREATRRRTTFLCVQTRTWKLIKSSTTKTAHLIPQFDPAQPAGWTVVKQKSKMFCTWTDTQRMKMKARGSMEERGANVMRYNRILLPVHRHGDHRTQTPSV